MKPISNLFAAFVFSILFVVAVGVSAPQIQAQVTQGCGCGNAKCGGCLKGKLFPVKNLTATLKPKKSCNCEACQQSQPPAFSQPMVTSHPIVPSQPVVTSDVLISTQMLPEVVGDACGCGQSPCRCRLKTKLPRTRSCPECDCDFCELKVEKSKEKKTCYEVKQKEVCVPSVRLPWKKNCPPTRSKVRVVNVLSKKTYECPKCNYEWKVYEPEAPKAPESKSSAGGLFGSDESPKDEAPKVEEVDPVNPVAPKMNVPEPPDVKSLDLDKVPRPPIEDAS